MAIIADRPAKTTPARAASLIRLVVATHLNVDSLGLLLSRPLSNAEHRQVHRAIGKSTYKDHKAHEIAQAHGWKRSWLMQSLTFRQIGKLAKTLDAMPMLTVIVNRLDVACDLRTATEDDGYAVDALLTGHTVVRPRRATQRLYRDRATLYHGRKWAATNFVHYCEQRAAKKMGGPGAHSEIRIKGTSATKYYGISDLKQITKTKCLSLLDKVASWCEHGDPAGFDAAVEAILECEIDCRMQQWDARLDTAVTGKERQQLWHRVYRTTRRRFAKLMYSRAVEDDDLARTDWSRHPMQNALAHFPQHARKSATKTPFGAVIRLIRETTGVNEGQSPCLPPVAKTRDSLNN